MSSNDRRHPRFSFADLPLVFSLQLEEAAPQDRPMRVEAQNISRCGIKFSTNRRIPMFSEVQIALFGKKDGRELAQVSGKIVRLEEIDTGHAEKTYGIALDFTSDSELLAKLLPERAAGTKESGT